MCIRDSYVLTEEDPLGCISLVEPHLDSDTAELDESRFIGVGYVSFQGLKRHAPFTIPLGAGDLGPAETATALNLDTACASSHCALDDLLHRALIGDTLLDICNNALCQNLGVEIGMLDLLDIDVQDFLLVCEQLLEVRLDLLKFGLVPADKGTRTRTVQAHSDIETLPQNLDLGNGKVALNLANLLANVIILQNKFAIVLLLSL